MASYTPITNTLEFPVAYKPIGAFPLDARSMFGSYASAVAAAATAELPGSSESIYYIGQTITVFEDDVVKTYNIQADKTLKEVGSAVLADGKTIEVGDDGATIALKGFGKEYYAYTPADNIIESSAEYTYPDNMPAVSGVSYVKISDVWYKYNGSAWAVADAEPSTTATYTKTTGWKAGLQPRVVLNAEGNAYEIAWYEPSTTTVEDISNTIGSLTTTVDSIQTIVNETLPAQIESAVQTESDRATGVEAALRTDVDANKAAITTLNGDASTEGSVQNQITTALSALLENPDESMNSLQELVDWVNTHATDAVTMSNNITANTNAINSINTLLGTSLPEGTTATTVIGYISEAVNAEADRAKAAEKANADAITALQTALDAIDVNAFATKEQGEKADTAVQSVVAGETNGHIAVDGTDVKVYELPKASSTSIGGIQADGTSITVSAAGVASVVAVSADKITGLTDKLNDTKGAAVTEANTYTNENAVLKTSVVADDSAIADSVTNASSEKVISEKLLMQLLEWKTEM